MFTERINIQYFFALAAMEPAFWIGQEVKFKVKKEMIEFLGHNFSQTAPVSVSEIRNWTEETGSTMWSSIYGKLPNWKCAKKANFWTKDAKAYRF